MVDKKKIQELANLSKDESNKVIDAMSDLNSVDRMMLKAKVNGARDARPVAAAAGKSDDLGGALVASTGVAGAAAGAAAARVMELLKGKTIQYLGRLDARELAGRIETKMGGKYEIEFNNFTVLVINASGEKLPEIRLNYNGEFTDVTIGRADVSGVTSQTTGLLKKAMNQVAKGGLDLNSLVSLGQEAVEVAKDASGDLGDLDVIVGELELYGYQVEQTAEAARAKAKIEAEKAEEAKYLKTHCEACGASCDEGAKVCSQCGKPR